MISEDHLDAILDLGSKETLTFSLLSFLIYGWFGWIVYPIIGILFSPLMFIKYSLICRSFKKGMFYTKKKIYIMSLTGFGYSEDDVENTGLKIMLLLLVLFFIISKLYFNFP